MRFGIQAERLSKSFGEVEVLHDITFRLEEGSVGAIVGPSGSGKTPLLNLLSGVFSPDSGEVFVGGALVERAGIGGSVLHTPPAGRNVGYVFQDYLLFPHMTVFENVAYGLRARHLSAQTVTADVLKVLDTLGLGDLRAKKPAQLSGGQMQRVALGRAIVLTPKVLLMDEPLSALDRQTREALRSELRRVFDQFRTTVVYVTHDLDEAFYFGDKIGVLRSGTLSQLDTREGVLSTMSSATARFFGFNLLKVRFMRYEGPHSVFSATEWGGQVRVALIHPRQLASNQNVLLAFSPTSVSLDPARSGSDTLAGTVLDVQEFRDTIQAVVGDPTHTVTIEVSARGSEGMSLKRGDSVALSVTAAWAIDDAP